MSFLRIFTAWPDFLEPEAAHTNRPRRPQACRPEYWFRRVASVTTNRPLDVLVAVVVDNLERLGVQYQVPLANSAVLLEPPLHQSDAALAVVGMDLVVIAGHILALAVVDRMVIVPPPLRLLYAGCSSVMTVEPGSNRSPTMSANILEWPRGTSNIVMSGSSPVARWWYVVTMGEFFSNVPRPGPLGRPRRLGVVWY